MIFSDTRADYKAYDAHTKSVLYLTLELEHESGFNVPYHHMGLGAYSQSRLVFPVMSTLVTIEGENLLEMRQRMNEHHIGVIRVFDEQRHKKPEAGRTLVTKIIVDNITHLTS